MRHVIVDTSALFVLVNKEPEARLFASVCKESAGLVISTATLHEASCVAMRSGIADAPGRLLSLLEVLRPVSIAFDDAQLETARRAYARYGRGTGHPANLNMGDCFAYALVKTRKLPLLFKGDDFLHTDIEPALAPAAG